MIILKRISRISEKCVAPTGYHAVPALSWHTKEPYHVFSPFYLRTDGLEQQHNAGGIIFENFWQGSKVYPSVDTTEIYSNRFRKGKPIFKYQTTNGQTEKHIDNNKILPDYWRWRQQLWMCPSAVRYPVGRTARKNCAFSLLRQSDGTEKRLDYLESRKQIYGAEYKRLIRKLPEYQTLLNRLRAGEKLCIFEIDVPAPSKKGAYGHNCHDGYYVATPENLDILINDPSEPCGHGIFLAQAFFEDFLHPSH